MKPSVFAPLLAALALAGCNSIDTSETIAGGGAGLFTPDDDDAGGEGEGSSCSSIDFVFVVDNSPSMDDEQQSLANAVPGFVDAIRATLPSVESIRVGVVDTDGYPGIGSATNALDGCPDGTDCSQCDYTLGALVSKPLSASYPGESCEFSTGAAYMDSASPSFSSELTCAVTVGTEGNPVEQQAGALAEAISPSLTGSGGCNEGLVRDDALLVFVMISDEEDDNAKTPELGPQGGSLGDPKRWYDAVVSAKGGSDDEIVALGLLGGAPRFADCSELSVGNEGAEQSTRLSAFVDSFQHHAVGSVCGTDYADFFAKALATVVEGCEG